MSRRAWWLLPLVVVAASPAALAQRGAAAPTLHEPIPPDPREDLALSLTVDGDLPAAIQTPRGLVPAPDPARPVGTGEAPYGLAPRGDAPGSTYRPDRDTRRPQALPYDEPFSPSTAPFKRLSAFDAVNALYTLSAHQPSTRPLAISASPPPSASEEQFFADMVVDLVAGRKVRIPSVGPGARVLHARAGKGARDVRFTLHQDGADNWFIEASESTRARVVMELSIPRAVFGGDFGNPTRAALPPVAPLPPNVRAAAARVAEAIGVSERTPPREVVSKLVAYFRSFQETDEPLEGGADIYLDLALQKKGVCRHRAFAYLVTSLYVGVPARMITNEAHAWVEVHDGRLWRRIDLGGAGHTLSDPLAENIPYEPPPDPFDWPSGGARGEDLGERARRSSAGSSGGAAAAMSAPGAPSGDAASRAHAAAGGDAPEPDDAPRARAPDAAAKEAPDDRPPSTVSISLARSEAHRGAPLSVRGEVTSGGRPCPHVPVEIVLRSRGRGDVRVGALATDAGGRYAGALVLPPAVPLGDYDVHARTPGDARCGRGEVN